MRNMKPPCSLLGILPRGSTDDEPAGIDWGVVTPMSRHEEELDAPKNRGIVGGLEYEGAFLQTRGAGNRRSSACGGGQRSAEEQSRGP
jgi:hypothetical protein